MNNTAKIITKTTETSKPFKNQTKLYFGNNTSVKQCSVFVVYFCGDFYSTSQKTERRNFSLELYEKT